MGDIVRRTQSFFPRYFPSSIKVASQMDLRKALEAPGRTTEGATFPKRRANLRLTPREEVIPGLSGRWKP
jgi:hypothetical protein